jgi:hypothetical protein
MESTKTALQKAKAGKLGDIARQNLLKQHQDLMRELGGDGSEDLARVIHTETDPKGVEAERLRKELEEHVQVYEELMKEAEARRKEALKRHLEAISERDSEKRAKAEADYDQARKDWKQAFDEKYSRGAERRKAFFGEDANRVSKAGRITQRPDGKVTVWLSRHLIDMFSQGTNPLAVFSSLHGQNIGHPDIARKLTMMKTLLSGHPEEQRMLETLLTKAKSLAGPEGINLAVLEGKSIKELLSGRETHREEWSHGWQRQLLGKDISDAELIDKHLDLPVVERLHSILPAGMRKYLDTNYSRAGVKLRVVEAGAKLLSQHPSKFDMTVEEAADWLLEYTNAVADKYGNDAFKNLTSAIGVAKEIKNIYATLGEGTARITRTGGSGAGGP